MENKKYTWNYDLDDEIWTHDSFSTIEECVEDAKENYHYNGDYIVVGKVKHYEPNVDVDDVIERLQEQAYEDCGESSVGWIDLENKNVEILSERVNKIVKDWLKETNQEPTFYSIENIIKVETN